MFMNQAHPQSLLRRTAAAFAAFSALVALLFAAPAAALNMVLPDNTTCTFAQIGVDPNGNLTLSCAGIGNTNSAGNFTLVAPTSLTPSTPSSFSVTRAGGTTGTINVGFTTTGAGCGNTGGVAYLTFASGSTTSTPAVVPLSIGTSGSCTITLTGAYSDYGQTPAGGLTPPTTASVSVGGGQVGGNGFPVVPGCAAPASGAVMTTAPPFTLNTVYAASSGQVTTFPLPAPQSGQHGATIDLSSTPAAYTPSSNLVYYSISKCPGVIQQNPAGTVNFCNQQATSPTSFDIQYYTTGVSSPPINSIASASSLGYCWAGDGGQYYVNMMWTFSSCSGPGGKCGFYVTTQSSTF
jgi:hypothetical protein